MPKLIKLHGQAADWANDRFVNVPDEEPLPDAGGVILSLARFQTDGEALLEQGRAVGVRIEPDQSVEDLAYDLPRLSLVALAFAKFRDGRPYSSASLLRERFGFDGEVRAVGEVLREQAAFMVRCGFDAFEPADGSTPQEWVATAFRFRHVYQRAADDRQPAFVERES
jgi:uncharacterized protein (DUF934 family)